MRNSKKIRLWVFGTVITLILISIPTTGIVLYNRSLRTNDKTRSQDIKVDLTAKPDTVTGSNKEASSKPAPARTVVVDAPAAARPTANSQETPKQPVVATNASPQQPNTYQQPSNPIAVCNDSMKASYASLYNSQVNAENANWANQVNGWGDYASGHGMSFSGYVQDQINQNKPAHDARLAGLQTTYYQNLASVNCTQ